MKIHRFIGDFDLSQSSLLIKDTDLAKQMRSVLKLHTGEKIILSNGLGQEALCEVGGYGADSVSVNILEQLENKSEPASYTILYCAILKRENFELVAQKATEVGAKEIIPIITKRTVKLNLRPDRLEKIIKEAAEQSGRGVIPKIYAPMALEDALDRASKHNANFFFDPSGASLQKGEFSEPVGVFIGPEGGWEESEIELARAKGCQIVSLGKLTLRAETAAVIVSYLFA